MSLKTLWNRRTFLGSASLFAGTLFNARRLFAASSAKAAAPERLTGFGSTGNVYEQLGVTAVINAQGS